MVFNPEKAKTVLESRKMLNNEMEGSTKWSIQLRRLKLKTLQRKVPKSQIASFEKTAVKVFNSHMKHWIKQNVDAQI